MAVRLLVLMVTLAVLDGVTADPERPRGPLGSKFKQQNTKDKTQSDHDNELIKFKDEDNERSENEQSREKTACKLMDGLCTKLDGFCPGEMKTGADWCRGYKKWGCCIPPQKEPCDEPLDCVLDGKVYNNGCKTEERCIILECNNGTWDYYDWNDDCPYCYGYGDTMYDGYSYNVPYVAHDINGSEVWYYDFSNYNGTYVFTQSGLSIPTQTGIDITQDGTCTTSVLYKEPGLIVEIKYYSIPFLNAELLVNGVPLTLDSPSPKAIPVYGGLFGTVFIIFDWGVWPTNADIYIVGSQGLSEYIYFSCEDYDECCYTYTEALAMPSLDDSLFGLCDVLPPVVPPYPQNWTMSSDTTTTSLPSFIESWKLPTTPSNGRRRRTVHNNEPAIVKRSISEIEQECEKRTNRPCEHLPSEVCQTLKENCLSRMSGSKIPSKRSVSTE